MIFPLFSIIVVIAPHFLPNYFNNLISLLICLPVCWPSMSIMQELALEVSLLLKGRTLTATLTEDIFYVKPNPEKT